MTANQPPDPRFDAELKEWMEGQEPRRPADGVADAVIARVSTMNQGRQPSFLLSLGTAAMAAVVAAMALSTGVLIERATPGGSNGGSARPSPFNGPRIPAGGHVIEVGRPNVDLAFELFSHADGIWVATATGSTGGPRSLLRVDPMTGEIGGEVDNAAYAASDRDDLWTMVSDDGRGPGVLTQLDPITGAALRTLPGVEGYTITIDGAIGWVPQADALLRIDMERGEVIQRIDMPAPVWEDQPVLVTDGAVWVVVDPGMVKVDLSTQANPATVVFSEPVDFAVVGDGSIWARLAGRNVVVQIDPRTSSVIGEIALPTSQASIAWGKMTHADGGVWVAVAGGVVRIDTATGGIGDVVPLPWGFYWGVVARDGELWVSVMDESKVIRFPMPLD